MCKTNNTENYEQDNATMKVFNMKMYSKSECWDSHGGEEVNLVQLGSDAIVLYVLTKVSEECITSYTFSTTFTRPHNNPLDHNQHISHC